MKKVLFATTALVLTAGVAAADYKIGGTARVGLEYVEGRDMETQVNLRLRFNFDAFKELDNGVTVGGRIRMQYDDGDGIDERSSARLVTQLEDENGNPLDEFGDIAEESGLPAVELDPADYFIENTSTERGGTELAAAYVYIAAQGFRVEVGNSNTAFDSMNTLYNSEFGYIGVTQGSYNSVNGGNYLAYETSPYGIGQKDRLGVFASYTVGDLVARASYTTPDQTEDNLPSGLESEWSVSVDYSVGQFSFGAGYVANAGFDEDVNGWALTGEYAINDTSTVGLQFLGTDFSDGSGRDDNTGATLYGTTEFSGFGVQAFISTDDADGLENDIAYGIGGSYDLGGATLAGTIQQTFDEDMYADLGINFSF